MLADSIPILAWMADADGFIFWYNRRWYEYTGTTQESMAGWGWQSVHDPAMLPQVVERWKQSIATGKAFEMEFPLRGADGRFRWFLTRVSPMKDPHGRVVRWFGTNTDVDEVRTARETIAQGEERLRLALATARMGTYELTVATGKLAWSDQLCRLHGIEPHEFRGTLEHARELTHPEDLARSLQAMESAAASGRDFEIEYRTLHPKDGSTHWLFAYGRVLRDDTGAPVRAIGSVIDVTERKRAQDALLASVDSLQTLNGVGQLISAELDLDRLVQSVTDAATKLSGAQFGAFFYNVVNEQGRSYMLYAVSGVPKEAFAGFPMPRATAVFGPTFEGTGVVRSDDITKDPRYGRNAPHHGMPAGHLPVKSYLAVSVVSRTGDVLGGLFFGHAQPARFGEREQELVKGLAAQAAVAIDNARLFQRAQEAIALRDEFLSIASHELRTPLTPLKMHIQSLRRVIEQGTLDRLPPKRLHDLAGSTERQIDRLTSLIDDLLDVARITAGKFRLDRKTVDLVALVREALERYATQTQRAGCAVVVHAPARLDGEWDPLRVEQAFVNLLTNATKYAPGREIVVTVGQEDGAAVLSVKDQGIGIAAEDQERIFHRYERVGNSENLGGLGLGLFITRQIAEAHGGTVSVSSTAGQGACFTLRLPIETRG